MNSTERKLYGDEVSRLMQGGPENMRKGRYSGREGETDIKDRRAAGGLETSKLK